MYRIAIVEDFPAIRELYKHALEPIRAEIHEYPSGSIAVESIARFQPDLLILDHRLPDMSGYSVLERVPEIQQIPVIVISGYLDPQQIPHYQSLGVSTILTKPIDLSVLLEWVSSLLGTPIH